MATDPKSKTDVIYAAIDSEAADDAERSDSKVLYQALNARRGELGAAAEIPADDKNLSERIMSRARTRSEQISRTRVSSAGYNKDGKPIPLWLILAWLVAIAAIGSYFYFMQ
jgi:hypothetical protein